MNKLKFILDRQAFIFRLQKSLPLTDAHKYPCVTLLSTSCNSTNFEKDA